MLVTVSQVIKTFNGVCSYRLKLFKMSPLALDASTKMAAPLLHCSINDTLINRILHCQNMFTKLTTVLDLTFVPVIILCCEIYSRFCVPKIIIIIITFITCKLPSSFSKYSGYISQVWRTKLCSLISIFQDSTHQKLVKSVHL